MNSTGTTTSTNPIDNLNASNQAVASAADAQAATSVSTLGLIQQARLTNQNRAVTLAVAQFGNDSQQATAARQAATTTTATYARIRVLSQQVNTERPAVAATGWALYGRVYSSELTPLAGYTVFLVDAQKNYQSEYGFAYTDDTGYFLISYNGAPTGAPAPAATATPLFLEVADSNSNPVLLSETAFTPILGQATYQSVTLPAGGKPIGDPPPGVRSVALPPTKANGPSTQKANK